MGPPGPLSALRKLTRPGGAEKLKATSHCQERADRAAVLLDTALFLGVTKDAARDLLKRAQQKLQSAAGDAPEKRAKREAGVTANVAAALSSCDANDHVRRQTYLQLLAAAPHVELRTLTDEYKLDVGKQAWRTATGAVKRANFNWEEPAAPSSGRPGLPQEAKDTAAAVWMSDDFSKPDPRGKEGGRVLTVPKSVVADKLSCDGVCCRSKSYKLIPESLRAARQKSDVCPICDDTRLLPARREAKRRRMANPPTAVEQAQLDRIDEALRLGKVHKEWNTRQREALAADRREAANIDNKRCVVILDFKSSEDLGVGPLQRGPDFWNRGKAGVLGFTVYLPGETDAVYVAVVSPVESHTASAAQV